jgi:hypothetical protein
MFSFLLGHMRFYVRLGLNKRAFEASCILQWPRLPFSTCPMLHMSIKWLMGIASRYTDSVC